MTLSAFDQPHPCSCHSLVAFVTVRKLDSGLNFLGVPGVVSLYVTFLGLWSSCAVSVRDGTVETCLLSVVPPQCHRVTALSLAQVSPTSLPTWLTQPWPNLIGVLVLLSPSPHPSPFPAMLWRQWGLH